MRVLYQSFGALGVVALWLGMTVGLVGLVPFVWPQVTWIPFQMVRPLHGTLVMAWILAGASATVYHALFALVGPVRGVTASGWWQLGGGLFATLGIVWDYLHLHFGGREYLEFSPDWSPMIGMVAMLFALNVLRMVVRLPRPWPVYAWMWVTGAVGLMVAFAEAHLWLLPEVGGQIVRDTTFQWKAYGSLIGSWNMLIYGVQFYWLERLSSESGLAHSKSAFFFFFLGLFNLLFNWGHHLYPVPMASFIKHVAYAVSMTEWILLLKIVGDWWRQKGPETKSLPFFRSAQGWVAANLVLAIALSIPAVNLWTHGTPVTVAHAMGSTIGINTFLLLGALHNMAGRSVPPMLVGLCNLGLAGLVGGLLGEGIADMAKAAGGWGYGVSALGGGLLWGVVTLLAGQGLSLLAAVYPSKEKAGRVL